jgi:hypothetical protein
MPVNVSSQDGSIAIPVTKDKHSAHVRSDLPRRFPSSIDDRTMLTRTTSALLPPAIGGEVAGSPAPRPFSNNA